MATLSSTEAGRQIDSSVDLHGLMDTIVRRRWTILASVVVFTALAYVALSVVSPRYSATARIFIDPRPQRTVDNEVVQQGTNADMALIDSQIELIQSEAVLGRVVKDNDLAADPEFVTEPEDSRGASEMALAGLAKATTVARAENTYVLEIDVTTKEAAKSARLANAIVAAYVADRAASATNVTRDISSAIHGQLAELQKQLHDAEEKVETFKREHNITQAEGQLLGDRTLTDLANRQAQAAARVNETRARLQVMQEAMKARGSVGSAVSDTDSSLGALRIRLAEARQRLAELQQSLGPRHPRIVATQEEVTQAERAIRAEGERLVAAAQDDYETAAGALDKVNADLKQATEASFSTNQDMIRLRQLEREAQSVKVVYESFLLRAKETAQQESITANTARVIAEASAPTLPSFPPRKPMLAAGAVFGLFVGLLLAILQDFAKGLLTARRKTAPVVLAHTADAGAGADTETGGLALVTTLGPAGAARQAALELATGAVSRGRSVIMLDLAQDVSADSPGLAEIALGESSAYDAVRISPDDEVHILGAGRPPAVEKVSRTMFKAVLDVICAEYDDVVVNVGELDVEHSLPALVAADMTRHAVLVVNGQRADPSEKRVVEALSHNGEVSVSLVKARMEAELGKVA
ncbi:MAG: GumC family protein [Mesorhizobium sp.]